MLKALTVKYINGQLVHPHECMSNELRKARYRHFRKVGLTASHARKLRDLWDSQLKRRLQFFNIPGIEAFPRMTYPISCET